MYGKDFGIFQICLRTKMHSSRMRTLRITGHLLAGGVSSTPPRAVNPPGAGTPRDLLQGMLGYHLQCMLGYHTPLETCCKAC